jgi:hypothetical protein
VEIISGIYEGHRFHVDSATGADITIATGDPRTTTTVSANALVGSAMVVREYYTLGEILPASEFLADGDPNIADNILLYANGAWQVLYAVDTGGGNIWADSTAGIPVDLSNTCMDPCQAMFLHRRGATTQFTYSGMVRSYDFACPLAAGYNFVGSGYPLHQSAASRDMSVTNGFDGDGDITAADQVLFWAGDTIPGRNRYNVQFLLDVGAPFQYWTGSSDVNLNNLDTNLQYKAMQGAFINSRAGLPGYVVPLQWSSAP